MNKMTNKEYKQVVDELFERSKNLTFTHLSKKDMMKLKRDKRFTVTMRITFIEGDIREILGGIRRRVDCK